VFAVDCPGLFSSSRKHFEVAMTRGLRLTLFSLVAVALPCLVGCATVFQGTSQRVTLRSDPDSARFTLDDFDMGTTPARLRIDRSQTHVVKVQKPGYAPQTMVLTGKMKPEWVALDIVCGVTSVVVDGVSGNWKGFDDELHVSLTPGEGSAADTSASPADHDTLATANGRQFLPDGIPTSALHGRALVTCHARPAPVWVDHDEGDFEFGGGAKVSRHASGTFRDQKIKIAQGNSFYLLLPSGEMYRIQAVEILKNGIAIEWRRH
jgi:PEGA domain-containing protein